MTQVIQLKRSAVAGKIPLTLAVGEISVNTADLELYVGTQLGVKKISHLPAAEAYTNAAIDIAIATVSAAGASQAEVDRNTRNIALGFMRSGVKITGMVDGFFDGYSDTSGITSFAPLIAGAGVISTDGALLSSVPSMTGDFAPSGQVIYSSQYNGVAAYNAFAGREWLSANPPSAAFEYIGYVFPVATVITSISFAMNPTYSVSGFYVQYSDDGAFWANLSIQTGVTWVPGVAQTFSFANTIPHRYYRVYFPPAYYATVAFLYLRNLKFITGVTSNGTVISAPQPALAQPSKSIFTCIASIPTSVLNTDLVVSISRDGGTTWTLATLIAGGSTSIYVNPVGNMTGTILSATVDLSSQPAGTSLRYKIDCTASKKVNIYSAALNWK